MVSFLVETLKLHRLERATNDSSPNNNSLAVHFYPPKSEHLSIMDKTILDLLPPSMSGVYKSRETTLYSEASTRHHGPSLY